MMLDNERLEIFLQSLKRNEPECLISIKEKARKEQVPIIRDEMADLLVFLMKLIKPKRILEVGAAVGYSALVMNSALDDVSITTMELDHLRAEEARKNFADNGADNIVLHEGDADTILDSLESESYDFIFMDAAKGQYLNWLPKVLRLLVKGGVLVTDNILFDGDVLQPRYAVCRRDRTIHSRMREYLYVLKNTEGLFTSILNVGDGAALSMKE